ncbi:hypothetical protein M0R45_017790 [Rubus argutus]|uniref:Coiled-coil domain-containing protein 22 n=1 Tax=Rubus argutus TaxID=59490 RepID=A0AAW1XWY8_RUBAR
MEDSREILLNSLEDSGVRVPNDVSSVRDLTPAGLVSICGQSLNLVAQTGSFPTSLPDSSVADQFKVCTDMASGIKSLGYLGDMSFHKFLYPSEEDSYKLVRFLVERLAESSGSGSRAGLKGVDDIRKVKEESSKSNPASRKSGDGSLDFSYDKLGPKWDEFTLKGEEPEVLNINGEDASVGCDANLTLQRLDEMSIDNVSSRPGDMHSSKEKQLAEEVTAKTSELKHLEEELELLKEAAEMVFDVNHPVEFYLEKLNQQVDAQRQHLGELKSQQEVVRRPLEEKKKSPKESLYANDPVALEKLQKLKDLELEKESILSGIRKREEELSQLSMDLEKQPKLTSRRSYIERVKEITKNSRKQEADIEQILKDTRELQLESNSIQERLHRTYAVVDELVFREAKKDAVGRQAYRLLTSIHESFEQIREKILATDRIRREATEHEKKLAAMASRSLNADKLQADLEAIRRENEYLEKSLQDI